MSFLLESGSHSAWNDLENEATTGHATSEDAEHPNQGKKKGPAAGGLADLEINPDTTLGPEAFFPPDPFEGSPRDSERDPDLVDSPFGAVRRGER